MQQSLEKDKESAVADRPQTLAHWTVLPHTVASGVEVLWCPHRPMCVSGDKSFLHSTRAHPFDWIIHRFSSPSSHQVSLPGVKVSVRYLGKRTATWCIVVLDEQLQQATRSEGKTRRKEKAGGLADNNEKNGFQRSQSTKVSGTCISSISVLRCVHWG